MLYVLVENQFTGSTFQGRIGNYDDETITVYNCKTGEPWHFNHNGDESLRPDSAWKIKLTKKGDCFFTADAPKWFKKPRKPRTKRDTYDNDIVRKSSKAAYKAGIAVAKKQIEAVEAVLRGSSSVSNVQKEDEELQRLAKQRKLIKADL